MDQPRFTVEIYTTPDGDSPLAEWIAGLDTSTRSRIQARILRMEHTLGDYKRLQGVEELFEARIFHGPGYRLYFTRLGDRIVILLCGGDKGSQKRDIAWAEKLRRQWLEETTGR